MSRSNPSDAAHNPATRWFEFASGEEGGYVQFYDKETEKQVPIGSAEQGSSFTFLLLDELATVKGWHEESGSGIFSNEVRDTRQDTLVVRSFKGGELASGLYADIRDSIIAAGGHFVASCYIAFRDAHNVLRMGNIRFKGAALAAWMEFKRECPSKKDTNGKTIKAYYVDAVRIEGFEQQKKGRVTYRVPVFELTAVGEDTNKQAMDLDAELQAYLADYLKRPRAEAAASTAKQEPAPAPTTTQAPPPNGGGGGHFDDMPDDIPFISSGIEADVITRRLRGKQ